MPPRSEPPAALLLDAAEGHLRVGTAAAMAAAVTRSHLADFRCVGWFGPVPPGWTLVLDAEVATAGVPPRLARRFGADRFWERWTRAECLCKLAGVPMLAWWQAHGLDVPDDFAGVWRTLRLGDLIVTVASDRRAAARPAAADRTPLGQPFVEGKAGPVGRRLSAVAEAGGPAA